MITILTVGIISDKSFDNRQLICHFSCRVCISSIQHVDIHNNYE
jgi:hypothetical protein